MLQHESSLVRVLGNKKHCLGLLYFQVPDVKEMSLKRWKNNHCDEGEVQDTDGVLDLEQKIYLEMFPYNKATFEDKDEDDDISEVEIVEGVGKTSS